jgi:hypothetical protein
MTGAYGTTSWRRNCGKSEKIVTALCYRGSLLQHQQYAPSFHLSAFAFSAHVPMDRQC